MMSGELKNEWKILEDKLYLLDSSLVITLKTKGQTTITYGKERLHSPTLEIYSLSNTYKLSGSIVDRTTVINYGKGTQQSLKKVRTTRNQ